VFIWTVLTVLAATGLSLTLRNPTRLSTILILIISTWLIVVFLPLVRKQHMSFRPEKYFMRINYYVLAVVLVLLANPMVQKLLQP
jgi:protoheme IX farnesyltransferase